MTMICLPSDRCNQLQSASYGGTARALAERQTPCRVAALMCLPRVCVCMNNGASVCLSDALPSRPRECARREEPKADL